MVGRAVAAEIDVTRRAKRLNLYHTVGSTYPNCWTFGVPRYVDTRTIFSRRELKSMHRGKNQFYLFGQSNLGKVIKIDSISAGTPPQTLL